MTTVAAGRDVCVTSGGAKRQMSTGVPEKRSEWELAVREDTRHESTVLY
jgi:hypothetical protein